MRPSSSATSTSSITWRPCSAGSPRRSSTSACASTSTARAGCSRPAVSAPRRGSCSRARSPRLRAAAAVVPETQMVEPGVELRRGEGDLRAAGVGVRAAASWTASAAACRQWRSSGKPNSALSSFVSGSCVSRWRVSMPSVRAARHARGISSPDAATRVRRTRPRAGGVARRAPHREPAGPLGDAARCSTASNASRATTSARVRVEVDPRTARIIGTAGAFDVTRALSLGFTSIATSTR